jgi:uncharacterized protein (DUF4415 family)
MAKKQSASSVRGLRTAKSVKHIPDEKIDYSDIPASTDEELKRAKRVGRPSTGNAKRLIAIRIDPKVLTQLRKLALEQDVPYQTFIHGLLEKAAKKAA